MSALTAQWPLPRKATCPEFCEGHDSDPCTPDGYDGICNGPMMPNKVHVYGEDGAVFADLESFMFGPHLSTDVDLSKLTAQEARALADGLVAAADWLEARV